MACWFHTLQQFQFSIVHKAGHDHGNADGLSRVPTSPCMQCTRVDCPPVDTAVEVADQPFDAESVGYSEDADLVPCSLARIGWLNLMMICPDRPPRLGRLFVLPPFSSRILLASCYWNGSGQMLFPHGRK